MFKKEIPISSDDIVIGCINCSSARLKADMNMVIAVGLGEAYATRNDVIVYFETADMPEDEYLTVQDIENMALADPDNDWRIHKRGPFTGVVFQRHGLGEWICIESDRGFA